MSVWRIILMIVTLLFVFGCKHMERRITHTNWVNSKKSSVLYLGYWEGECWDWFGGCSVGAANVRSCMLRKDNTVTCTVEKDVAKALPTD